MNPAQSPVVFHYAATLGARAADVDEDEEQPGSRPAGARVAAVAPPALELAPAVNLAPAARLPDPPPPGEILPPPAPVHGPSARWRAAGTAALVAGVGLQNAIIQGAGQLAALVVTNEVISPLVVRSRRDSSMSEDGLQAAVLVLFCGALMSVARGFHGVVSTKSPLVFVPCGLTIARHLAPALMSAFSSGPYRQIGVTLFASQVFRVVSAAAADFAESLGGAIAGRIQLTDAPGGGAPRGTLALLDRDRRNLMNCVHVALAVFAGLMVLRPPSAMDGVLDAELASPTGSDTLQPAVLPLWIAVVAGMQAFMETWAGAAAASNRGLALAPAGPSGLASPCAAWLRVLSRLSAREEAESLALDLFPALMRTVREAAGGVAAGGRVVQQVTSGLAWLAQGLSRGWGAEVQDRTLRQLRMDDPQPQAQAFRDLEDPQSHLVQLRHRPLGEIVDRYDVYLGTSGSALQFGYKRGEGQG